MLYALKYPGSKQIIFRTTYRELETSLIIEHYNIFPDKPDIYKYNATGHYGRFFNGSIIWFSYLGSDNDVYAHKSAQYDVIRFDELSEFSEFQYTYMLTRCRGTNGYPKIIRSSTNPGGSWVKRRFIDCCIPDKIMEFPVDPDNPEDGTTTRIFIPAKVTDNLFLMDANPEYIKSLKMQDEDTKRKLLYGDWDAFEGQFFSEFNREIHVAKRTREIPNWWRRYVTFDYGMDMLAALWIAVDNNGRAVVYKELYEGRDYNQPDKGKREGKDGHIIKEAARRLREVNDGDRIDLWLAPPDLWNRRQESGKSAADLFFSYGVPVVKSPNNRINGWRAVHDWLVIERNEFGEKESRLTIFPNCVNLIRTLPALMINRNRPEDVENEPHELTHAPDALRGFCAWWAEGGDPYTAVSDYYEEDSDAREADEIARFLGYQ